MDKKTFDTLTLNQKWDLIDSKATINSAFRHNNIIPCKPCCIGPLYTNTPMPHHETKDGTKIQFDDDNVYNGYLREENAGDFVFMNWDGYTCQLYDGTLKMCPTTSTSVLNGVCNGVKFRFIGSEHDYGCWPAFLEMYHQSK